jgi:hypothetical protein
MSPHKIARTGRLKLTNKLLRRCAIQLTGRAAIHQPGWQRAVGPAAQV